MKQTIDLHVESEFYTPSQENEIKTIMLDALARIRALGVNVTDLAMSSAIAETHSQDRK